jgi:hypothetical protein
MNYPTGLCLNQLMAPGGAGLRHFQFKKSMQLRPPCACIQKGSLNRYA